MTARAGIRGPGPGNGQTQPQTESKSGPSPEYGTDRLGSAAQAGVTNTRWSPRQRVPVLAFKVHQATGHRIKQVTWPVTAAIILYFSIMLTIAIFNNKSNAVECKDGACSKFYSTVIRIYY